jgi:hypothetical protein
MRAALAKVQRLVRRSVQSLGREQPKEQPQALSSVALRRTTSKNRETLKMGRAICLGTAPYPLMALSGL